MSRVKTIITTDMEVDDMNSLIHLCLYLNNIDVLGIIYTSSQYHFNGDGIHTLGEITPNYRCSGPNGLVRPRAVHGPDPEAVNCKSFRPFEEGWIERLWQNEYAQAYPYLIQHDSRYPSPEYLLSITKYGNIEFEGDVRFDTEGSDMIRDILMQDNDDVIYLQSWGGINTIVRALLSIYERYGNGPDWERIRDKVSAKTRISGLINQVGQDNSYLDNRINELYPDIEILRAEFGYGGYLYSKNVQQDCWHMFTGSWMRNNIQEGNGPLMESYHLMGDGKYVKGEAEIYQFGINPVLDFGKPGIPPAYFEKYEFLGEGDSNTYIDLLDFGFRGTENYGYGTLMGVISSNKHPLVKNRYSVTENPFLQVYQQDWAGRAKWCCRSYEQANHAPEIMIEEKDIIAAAGQDVHVSAKVYDPDGDNVSVSWEFYHNFSNYQGERKIDTVLSRNCNFTFTVPEDAKPGDYFTLTLRAVDDNEVPMTAIGQVIIKTGE